MKTSEEVLKDQFYAGEWDELMSYMNTDITPSILSAMKEYAKQVAEDVRQRCADNAATKDKIRFHKPDYGQIGAGSWREISVDEQSILKTEIITP